jgi:sodium transport system permease protein
MRQTWIVFRKEIVDNLRDRRSITSALVASLINPILFMALIGVLTAFALDQAEKPLDIAVVGRENSPSLVDFLKQNNVNILPPPADPEMAVRSGDESLVLIIPPGYTEAFSQGRPAQVELVIDRSNSGSDISIRRAQQLLQQYSGQIGALRLLARGISPSMATALAVKNIDVSTEQSRSAQFLSLLPMTMLIAAFTGGLYLAIDTTAGERERGSLEPLLLNPVSRRSLVFGKLGATVVFAVVAVFITIVVFAGLISVNTLQSFIPINVSFRAADMVTIFIITLPVVLLAAALQVLVSSYARSVKEAQTYTSYLIFLPTLPGVFLSVLPVKAALWMVAIPVIGQIVLILKIFRGEALAQPELLVATGTTVLLTVAGIVATIRLYEREKILFGR